MLHQLGNIDEIAIILKKNKMEVLAQQWPGAAAVTMPRP